MQKKEHKEPEIRETTTWFKRSVCPGSHSIEVNFKHIPLKPKSLFINNLCVLWLICILKIGKVYFLEWKVNTWDFPGGLVVKILHATQLSFKKKNVCTRSLLFSICPYLGSHWLGQVLKMRGNRWAWRCWLVRPFWPKPRGTHSLLLTQESKDAGALRRPEQWRLGLTAFGRKWASISVAFPGPISLF